jgi:hypothetical protein
MRIAFGHEPRPTSLPRAEILRRARVAIADQGGPDLARVHFKYDCDGCRRRVKIVEPNTLATRARCDACGTWTTVTAAGFDLVWRGSVDTPWAPEPGRLLTIRRTYMNDPQRATATEIEL